MVQFGFTAKFKLFISFLLLLLTSALAQSDIPTDYEGSGVSCGGKAIMNGSDLEGNLKVVLNSLVENVNKTGYNISWHGENGDKIYGLVQCRGDLNPPTCGECASSAQDRLNETCHGVSSGSVQLKGCFMRYATHNFYSQVNTTVIEPCVNNTDSNATGRNGSISSLLRTLEEKTVSSDVSYSTGNENGIYSLAQCWGDLTMNQCEQCLNSVYKYLLECSAGKGFTDSCMIRYETYKFYIDVVSSPSTQGKDGPNLPLLLGLSIPGFVIVLLLGVFLIWKRKVLQHFHKKSLPGHDKLSIELSTAISKSKLNYKYSTLRAATKNFNPANKIGEGGFGSVYKGILPNGNEVAVKKLFTDKEKSVSDFFNEVILISNVQHRNLVKLLGCCVDSTDRLLVYEYLPNKSLDLFIFDEYHGRFLEWQWRFEIILGVAAGIAYLHQESDIRIIHRDIKASNILLDQHFKPKIADFGLIRYFAEDQTHLDTTIVGTRGYMAPEYLVHGHLTEKVDIYAFGVLVLEIISGRKNQIPISANDMPSLLTMVWNNYLSGTILNVIGPNLETNYKEEVVQVVHVALLCTQASAGLRPSMSNVIMFLRNKSLNLPAATPPPFVDMDSSQSSAHTSVASAYADVHTSSASASASTSTSEARNPLSNIASSSTASVSSNTISRSSFGPR